MISKGEATGAKKIYNKFLCLSFIIISLIGLLIVLSKYMDFIFISNDDIYIRAILSGDLTGTSDAHVVYILYPLAWIFAGLYKINQGINWYGGFIVGIHFLCWGIVILRIVLLADTKWRQIRNFFITYFVLFILDLQWLIFSQYTALAGIIGCTAIICIVTIKNESKWTEYILPMALLTISFLLRIEAALMCIPFLFSFFIFKILYYYEVKKKDISKKIFKNSLIFFLVLSILFGGLFGIHKLAYQSNEWQQYSEYNKYRTEVYDYYLFPDYEGNEEFYNAIDIPKSEMYIIISANLDLDRNISTDTMKAIYEKSKEIKDSSIKVIDIPRRILFDYLDTFDEANRELIAIYLLYGALIMLIVLKKKNSLWIGVAFVFSIRSALRSYLFYIERFPERVTSPLAFLEFAVLGGIILIILRETRDGKSFEKKNSKVSIIGIFIIGMFMLLLLADVYKENLDKNIEIKKESTWTENLFPYLNENKNNVYLLEVCSIAAMKAPVFGENNEFPNNAINLGGWMQNSPLLEQQYLNIYGAEYGGEIFFADNTYIVQRSDLSIAWIEEFYNGKGNSIEAQEVSYIENNGENIYSIIHLNQKE